MPKIVATFFLNKYIYLYIIIITYLKILGTKLYLKLQKLH